MVFKIVTYRILLRLFVINFYKNLKLLQKRQQKAKYTNTYHRMRTVIRTFTYILHNCYNIIPYEKSTGALHIKKNIKNYRKSITTPIK